MSAYKHGLDVLVLGYDSSAQATTLRDSPVEDQIYALQVAAAKTGSPSLIQAAKDLQTALSSWWATFSTGSIKDQAASLGKAIAKYNNGPDPLDSPPIKGGVSSAMQEQLFDKGATGKAELAAEDVQTSASERVQNVKDAAASAKKYVEGAANKANTTLIVVAVAVGIGALASIAVIISNEFGGRRR
jgi:hypothetical protein